MKCVFCDNEMRYTTMKYENKWGKKSQVVDAKVHVCGPCDMIVFEPEEARRLQELARAM